MNNEPGIEAGTGAEPKKEKSMSEHTEGPWFAVDSEVTRELFHGCIVIMAEGIDDAIIATIGEDVPGHEANARLLAAAPELLKTLLAMTADDAFAELCQSIGEEPEWLKMARNAIAKAQPNPTPSVQQETK